MTQIGNCTIVIPAGSISDQAISPQGQIDPAKFRQRVLQRYPVAWDAFRVWDAWQSNPVGTAATDDLALLSGALVPSGSAGSISAGDCKALGATTRRIAFFSPVPANYDDGETIQFRVRAAMETTVASVSCTVDLESFVLGVGANVGGDLITTGPQNMNFLALNDYDFQLDASLVDPGQLLLTRLTIAVNDAATGTVVRPTVYGVQLLADTRG
jgi:hypothetical protein